MLFSKFILNNISFNLINLQLSYKYRLTPEERLRAIKKEQALREYEKNKRKNVRIAIDLKTKQVVELPADPFEYKEDEPATASSKSKEQGIY